MIILSRSPAETRGFFVLQDVVQIENMIMDEKHDHFIHFAR